MEGAGIEIEKVECAQPVQPSAEVSNALTVNYRYIPSGSSVNCNYLSRLGGVMYPSSDHAIVASDDTIRQYRVLNQIYKQLGVSVPNCQIETKDGKTVLVVEELDEEKLVLSTDVSLDPSLEHQYADIVVVSLLTHHYHFPVCIYRNNGTLVVNPNLNWQSTNRFKFGQNVLVDDRNTVLTSDNSPSDYYEGFSDYYQSYIDHILPKNFDRAHLLQSLQKIKDFNKEKIVDFVKGCDLSMKEKRELLQKLLKGRDSLIRSFERIEETKKNEVSQTDYIEQFDKALEATDGYKKHELCIKDCASLIEFIEKYNKLRSTHHADPEKSVIKSNFDSRIISKQLSDLKDKVLGLSLNDLLNNFETVQKISEQLELAQKHSGIWKRLHNFDNLTQLNSALTNQLSKLIQEKIDESTQQINLRIRRIIQDETVAFDKYAFNGNKNYIRGLMSIPTLSQINAYSSLLDQISDFCLPKTSESFQSTIDELSIIRSGFIEECYKFSNSVVTHLTVPEALDRIVKDGKLESRSLQKIEHPEEVRRGGNSMLDSEMYKISLTINSAGLQYGGKLVDKSKQSLVSAYADVQKYDFDQSMGFITLFSTATTDREILFSTMSPEEVNVRNLTYNIVNDKAGNINAGVSIPLDSCRLLVPEKESPEYTNRLKELGKDDIWIQSHLIIYREYMATDTFVEYFSDHQTLGLDINYGMFALASYRYYDRIMTMLTWKNFKDIDTA